jgi:hypothetical protein
LTLSGSAPGRIGEYEQGSLNERHGSAVTTQRRRGAAVFDDLSSSALRVAVAGLSARQTAIAEQHREHRDPRLPGP